MQELRTIPEFNDYAFSKDGFAYSRKHGKLKKLAGGFSTKGYVLFSLCANGRQYTRTLHRLVYEAWSGQKIPNGMCVRHYNDIKTDNRFENLVLGTDKDNKSDMLRNGKRLRGETHPMRKLSKVDVLQIISCNESIAEIATRYSVSEVNIRNIRNGKIWKSVTESI